MVQVCPDYSGKPLGMNTCFTAFIAILVGLIAGPILLGLEKLLVVGQSAQSLISHFLKIFFGGTAVWRPYWQGPPLPGVLRGGGELEEGRGLRQPAQGLQLRGEDEAHHQSGENDASPIHFFLQLH